MSGITTILIFTLTFIIIAVASEKISKVFVKIKLPQITGFLLIGILTGPFLLNMLKGESLEKLNFINETSLAFIAYAAGAELYLNDLRSRFKSITWMTFGQLIVTFVLSTVIILLIADYIPFISEASFNIKLSIAILASTIFVARSPASAIAVISEMRAKGPFTQTVMGVTVIKDVLVIILFAITFSISKTLIGGEKFGWIGIIIILAEITASFIIGYIVGKLISFVLSLNLSTIIKSIILLIIGYCVYLFSKELRHYSEEYINFEIYLEPLLICIIASFVVTNYSKFREEFHKIIHDVGPIIYVAFFTLTGASVSIDIFLKSWLIALIFFAIRLLTMTIGAFIGGVAGGDPPKLWKFGWMPYITQAGVGLGLVMVVSGEFSEWGQEFATVLISVIVLNQIIGPPLFKWVLHYVGESHQRGVSNHADNDKIAYIFGLDDQSIALARQLENHNWIVTIATRKENFRNFVKSDIKVLTIDRFSSESLIEIGTDKADAIVALNSDKANLQICEIAYEQFGTKDIVVRLNDRDNFEKFHELGVLIVDPSTALVSLYDHLVRSPVAASLLLGLDESQDTIDIEIVNKDIHGLSLRQLHLPCDVLVLSIKRAGHTVISHGYTRIRLGDIVTVIGSNESLDAVSLKFE